MLRCKRREDDRELVNLYRTGLCQEIKREVLMHDFNTIDEIYNNIKRVELELRLPNIRDALVLKSESP